MKFALVVASGLHQGKEITVPGTQLVIGRDEGCHLRPASPAISKKHCAVFLKGDAVFVKDMGSTNGTFLNDVVVEGEQPVKAGDRLRVGPLDFTIKLIAGPKSEGTPLPAALQSAKPEGKSSAAIKPVAAGAAKPPTPSAAQKPVPPLPPAKPARTEAEQGDDAAAMLLGMGEDDQVPEGSTVMDMPAVDFEAVAKAKMAENKAAPPPDSASAARDLLNKLTRRPR